jgi:phytoene desaturase
VGAGEDRRPHAVVIGAGFGGLAAAVRLGVRGYRVTVLDRLDQAGGRAYVRRREGFTFDSGPTVITAPQLFEELWELCGKKLADHVDMRPVTPFYRIRFSDGQIFNYTGDGAGMREEVRKISPADVSGYEKFLKKSEEIFRVGFEQLAHVPFGSWGAMARIVPEMMKLGSFRSVHGMVAQYVKDERLRQVLSFHPLLVGGNPFSTTSIYTLIAFLERKWGVHFPIGGTGALVEGLVELITGLGGSVRLGAEIERIQVESVGGKSRAVGVRLKDGSFVAADLVISNADSAWTYRYLLSPDARAKWTDRKVESMRYSMGLFVWYFGTKKQFPDVAHHTILLGPRYRGLLGDIFDRQVLADDFSLYLHRPTATDPSLAPEGCDAFYVLSPVPHLGSGTDWRKAAEPYRLQIERYLETSVLPGLRESLVVSETLDPQGFHDTLGAFRGAAFGMEPVLTQSAYFRPHNESEDVENLFLVGAGTHPGAGVPGVLSSARVLDTLVPPAAAWNAEPAVRRKAMSGASRT